MTVYDMFKCGFESWWRHWVLLLVSSTNSVDFIITKNRFDWWLHRGAYVALDRCVIFVMLINKYKKKNYVIQ